MRFRFPVIRLVDYADKLNELLESDNPFAIVTAAHILTRQTADDKTRRRREKMMLIHLLYEKQLSRQDIINLFRFIDWIMQLPEIEEHLFWEELTDFEGERKMPYITSVERIGYKRGESAMLSKMIAAKFGLTSKDIQPLIHSLPPELIEKLAEQFFIFKSSDDFYQWIANNSVNSEQ